MIKVRIEQVEGSEQAGQAYYTYGDVHQRRYTISLDGIVCGVIFHVGGIGYRNGRLDRGEWVADVMGCRIARSAQFARMGGMVRRALADARTLARVLDGTGDKADVALVKGENERFEELAGLARIIAAEVRRLSEAEALEVQE